MSSFSYTTSGVCARSITISVENNIVKNVSYKGGCSGNLQAVSRLVEGLTVQEVVKKLRGIDCGGKQTSCADQLAKALEERAEKNNTNSKVG